MNSFIFVYRLKKIIEFYYIYIYIDIYIYHYHSQERYIMLTFYVNVCYTMLCLFFFSKIFYVQLYFIYNAYIEI